MDLYGSNPLNVTDWFRAKLLNWFCILWKQRWTGSKNKTGSKVHKAIKRKITIYR
jgi:hypothetical protein